MLWYLAIIIEHYFGNKENIRFEIKIWSIISIDTRKLPFSDHAIDQLPSYIEQV